MIGRAGAALLCLLAAPAAAAHSQNPYADRATQALVDAARARHQHQDSLVRDYRATVTTRIDASAGRSRFARQFPLIAHETRGRLAWRYPNDLRMDVQGVRTASAFRDVDVEMGYDRPWFVPRALGDSIRLMGGIPETAALHPLAPGAERFYRYAIADSIIVQLPGKTVRAIGIEVTPVRLAPSMIAGMLWVDADGSDVVRLQGTVLGDYVWDAPDSAATPKDSAEARRDNRMAQRFITVQVDLEYALLENRFWMPFRQTLALLLEVEFIVKGAMPVRALTTFSDYEINTDAPIVFAEVADSLLRRGGRTLCPDGEERCPRRDREGRGFLRAGLWEEGRWEVRVPSRDSMADYHWPEPLALELAPEDEARIRESIADLSRQMERLPDEWAGRRALSLDWERLADIARFNRVQGLSLGAGVQFRPGPAFTTLDAAARFGLADERVTGSLTWRREAPDGGLEVRAFRTVLEAEPWSRGQSLGNTLNATFAGHDDADYYLALGGSVRYLPYHGVLEDVELTLGFERHRSMVTATGSPVNDFLGGTGVFPPNPAIAPGEYVRGALSRHRRFGPVDLRLGVEALVGDSTAGRGWLDLRGRFEVAGRRGAVTLRSAYALGDTLPQLFFRAGGPATVRGYDYGARVGRGGWSAQVDLALSRRWLLAPVIFADVGDTFRSGPLDPLVGVGGGISLLGGWIRANGSVGLNPKTDFRFDLLFGAPR
jgi:hypothetical protein